MGDSVVNISGFYNNIPFVADALKTLDPVLFGKWGHYLGLKAAVYEAYVSPLSCNVLCNVCAAWLHLFHCRPTVSMARSYWS